MVRYHDVCMPQAEGETTSYNCLSDFSDWLEGPALGCAASYNGGAEVASCMVSNQTCTWYVLVYRTTVYEYVYL